ncbi:MAG TPA: DoxX family protein [Hanamia sp.]|nr:DoxX family protein [Hanamia sp.]
MKKLLSVNHVPGNINVALLIGRISIAAFMWTHGLPKMDKFAETPVRFMEVLGMSHLVSLSLTVFAEVICSLFILLGFATRLAVIPLLITMLVAVFYVHGNDPFGKQEMGLLYILTYVMLLIMGSGKYSIDNLLYKKRNDITASK